MRIVPQRVIGFRPLRGSTAALIAASSLLVLFLTVSPLCVDAQLMESTIMSYLPPYFPAPCQSLVSRVATGSLSLSAMTNLQTMCAELAAAPACLTQMRNVDTGVLPAARMNGTNLVLRLMAAQGDGNRTIASLNQSEMIGYLITVMLIPTTGDQIYSIIRAQFEQCDFIAKTTCKTAVNTVFDRMCAPIPNPNATVGGVTCPVGCNAKENRAGDTPPGQEELTCSKPLNATSLTSVCATCLPAAVTQLGATITNLTRTLSTGVTASLTAFGLTLPPTWQNFSTNAAGNSNAGGSGGGGSLCSRDVTDAERNDYASIGESFDGLCARDDVDAQLCMARIGAFAVDAVLKSNFLEAENEYIFEAEDNNVFDVTVPFFSPAVIEGSCPAPPASSNATATTTTATTSSARNGLRCLRKLLLARTIGEALGAKRTLLSCRQRNGCRRDDWCRLNNALVQWQAKQWPERSALLCARGPPPGSSNTSLPTVPGPLCFSQPVQSLATIPTFLNCTRWLYARNRSTEAVIALNVTESACMAIFTTELPKWGCCAKTLFWAPASIIVQGQATSTSPWPPAFSTLLTSFASGPCQVGRGALVSSQQRVLLNVRWSALAGNGTLRAAVQESIIQDLSARLGLSQLAIVNATLRESLGANVSSGSASSGRGFFSLGANSAVEFSFQVQAESDAETNEVVADLQSLQQPASPPISLPLVTATLQEANLVAQGDTGVRGGAPPPDPTVLTTTSSASPVSTTLAPDTNTTAAPAAAQADVPILAIVLGSVAGLIFLAAFGFLIMRRRASASPSRNATQHAASSYRQMSDRNEKRTPVHGAQML